MKQTKHIDKKQTIPALLMGKLNNQIRGPQNRVA